TCYAARFDDPLHALDDARAFATLLRSPPIAAWLAALAEPARGGYRRFLAWTVAALPLPSDWPAARTSLAHVSPSANAATLTHAVASAYSIPPDALAPLLTWAARATSATPLGNATTRALPARPLRPSIAEPAAPAWARRPRPHGRAPASDGRRPPSA
ncbi:MAG TPA: hypothetical protein VGD56_05185, partial [Gemmatirosa sp.]